MAAIDRIDNVLKTEEIIKDSQIAAYKKEL
jgi:hypothetical protein